MTGSLPVGCCAATELTRPLALALVPALAHAADSPATLLVHSPPRARGLRRLTTHLWAVKGHTPLTFTK